MGAPVLEQFKTAPTFSDFKYLLKTHLFTVVYAGEYVGIGVGAVVVMYCLSVCFWYLQHFIQQLLFLIKLLLYK